MGAKPKSSILDQQIPDTQYIGKLYDAPIDPIVQLTRWRILQACQRLGVDLNRCTDIALTAIPDFSGMTFTGDQFQLPTFDAFVHSEAAWKQLAQEQFNVACESFLRWVRKDLEVAEASGSIIAVRQRRKGSRIAPLDVRCEWVVKKRYWGMTPKDIIVGTPYQPGQVAQAIVELLKEADLK